MDLSPLNATTASQSPRFQPHLSPGSPAINHVPTNHLKQQQQLEDGNGNSERASLYSSAMPVKMAAHGRSEAGGTDRQMTTVSHNGSLGRNSTSLLKDSCPESSSLSSSPCRTMQLPSGDSHSQGSDEVSREFHEDMDCDSDRDEEVPVECAECGSDFPSMQDYVDHACQPGAAAEGDDGSSDKQTAASDSGEVPMDHSDLGDAESFNGKIVYNPDGSAYIIEGSDFEDSYLDTLDMPRLEGAIVDRKGQSVWSSAQAIPQIANAVFVTKGPASVWSGAFRTSPTSSSSQRTGHDAPTMHSFRVYDVRNSQGVSDSERNSLSSRDSKFVSLDLPAKPILMCFICKLSFGYAKSFIAHAVGEHSIVLSQEERTIMARPKASAILQGVGKEKSPLLSFLDPLSPPPGLIPSSGSFSSGSTHIPYYLPSSVSTSVSKVPAAPTKVSYMYTKPQMSKDIALSPSSGSQDPPEQFLEESASRTPRDVMLPGMEDSVSYPEDEDSIGPEDSNEQGWNMRQDFASGKSTIPSSRPSRMSPTIPGSSAAGGGSSRLETPDSISLPSSLDTLSAPGMPGSHMPSMFLGSCDEHPQGRAQGVECPKCDMVLGSSQSLGGHMTMMHSRNSCKTLKCPKCNWHYKYQETLEIHMKEKHPDNDAQCIYCLTNQQHPRLARGETYSCGYKPYRCEVCNYSTTTKGNLSIHMQSDKHMNNMQELANGSADMPIAAGAPNHGPSPASKAFPPDDPQYKKLKPKQSWRCDVCNYETMVARNLRIHMTSEKHTHNMMVLQQNMKHMRRDMQLQMNQLMLMGQQDPTMFGLPSPLPPGLYPYDQSMLMPGAPPMFDIPVNLARENGSVSEEILADNSDASKLYQCCICSMHATDSLDSLHQHLQLDRTKQHESDNISVSNGTYMCNLCTYKTNLKANFQLHCKTDKHIQRLQLVNHIKEGGPANEWRLNFINASNPTQVRCNACNFYTSSVHKLQVHAGSIQHESNAHVFRLLQLAIVRLQAATAGATAAAQHYYYRCVLCGCNARTKQAMVQHARTLKHLQHEQAQLTVDPRDIFIAVILQDGDNVVYEYDEHDGERASDATFNSHPSPATLDIPDKLDLSTATPVTATTTTTSNSNNNNGTSAIANVAVNKPADVALSEGGGPPSDNADEPAHQTKDATDFADTDQQQQQVQRPVSPGSRPESRLEVKAGCVLCPLCQDECEDVSRLQSHLALSHKVTQEGLQRLLHMVDLPPPSATTTTSSPDPSPEDNSSSFTIAAAASSADRDISTNSNDCQEPVAPTSASPMPAACGDTSSAPEAMEDDMELDMERLELEHQKLVLDDAVDSPMSGDKADANEDQYRCQICTKTFINIDLLYAHQNELGHLELKQTPRGPGYLCWKKGCNQYFKTAQALQVHFREIHCKRNNIVPGAELGRQSFKCGQCLQAFRTESSLEKHRLYHLAKAITQCSVCQKSFPSSQALKNHLTMAHAELKPAEQDTLLKALAANLALLRKSPGFETFLAKFVASGLNLASSITSSQPPAPDGTRPTTLPHSAPDKSSHDKPVSKQKGIDGNGLAPSKQDETMDDVSAPGSVTDSVNGGSDKMEAEDEAEQLEMLKKSFPDPQALEDFINSQAMAEGNYEDPSRKFKCHRCKVGFTKQSYLTAHNKTQQHRRGDKVNYSVERYLDPSRPYKCDVCKESFTQKNILLVHYNSVSHLHKLKQAAQQGTLPSSVSSTSADPSPSQSPNQTSTTASTTSSSTTTTANGTTVATAAESTTERKPYRCNICKASYSQSNNLENHLRSVSHQNRVARIHELVMAGQININQPLIEQPDILADAQSQQIQQMMMEAMQQQQQLSAVSSQSLLFQTLPGLNSMPMFPGIAGLLPPVTTSLPSFFNSTTAALASFANAVHLESEYAEFAEHSRHRDSPAGSKNSAASDRGSEKMQGSALNLTSDSAEAHRSMKPEPDSFVKALTASIKKEIDESNARKTTASPVFQNHPVSQKSEMATNTVEGLPICRSSDQPSNPTLAASMPLSVSRPRGYMGRFKPQIHRNLLENIGFECVMQFNECTQSRKRDREKEKEAGKDIELEKATGEEKPVSVKEEKEEEDKKKVDLPEINKSRCLMCGIEFSSLFVLKAHEEEVHNSIVPIGVVEDFGEKFKEDLEKKMPKNEPEPIPASTPQPIQVSQSLSTATSADKVPTSKGASSEMPPPPPPPPQLPSPYDMAQMMPMLGMMHSMPMPMNLVSLGMQPSLMPMMPGASMDMSGNFPLQLSMMDPSLMSTQQLQQAASAAQNQKRVRTRISDEQLKILRAHFDINNSPSEEQINQMSEQSGLPQKVIKHWFRNTLFKERQRNKDSPYNFSNPPSTTIDLEEYEKTGKIPQVKIEPSDDDEESMHALKQEEGGSENKQDAPPPPATISADPMPKLESGDERREHESRSNASTPSNMSSIPSTPTCSAPPTPTPTATPGSIVDTHVAALARESAAAAAAAASSGQSNMAKRANRTRFTDYQIKQLQDYFEQNAYPKDDELDHLSRLLNLSPRVIVVWFQNARQKARKIYENQPAGETQKDANSPFQRTPSLNYQCKKCGAVFQRYYELIKHQKRPCLSENNNNKPLPSFTDDDSISSGTSLDDSCLSDSLNASNLSIPSQKEATSPSMSAAFRCDKCSSNFNRIDLWQEHQKIHSMTTTLFPPFSSSSAFGMLQSLAQQEDSKVASSTPSPATSTTPVKRKMEGEEEKYDDQPRDKRLRTTILPEQLDYLYQKYQIDCNPSRKQLESIAQEVGLKKRVVQVWFQNTRARERKGQYRAHQQLIHKRCPFCRALFRAKSALESHLATKHPEEMAKGEINVDAIPDATLESPQPAHSMPSTSTATHSASADTSKILSPSSVQPYLSFMPPVSLSLGFPPAVPTDPQLQLSMKQIYEDSYKKYINELSASTHPPKASHVMETPSPSRHAKPEKMPPPAATSTNNDDDAPLDLSIPMKPSASRNSSSGSSSISTTVSNNNSSHLSQTSSSRSSFIEMANREFERHRQNSHNESFSETHSDLADSEYQSEVGSSPSSPKSASGMLPIQTKRYRTQMTSLQVKVMKTLFVDYKTPTMSECELLGREIGLPKRVVQVWFQNARAKEKKSKLTMAKTFGGEMDFPKAPEECNLCSFKYSHKFTVQDHIFTKRHIDNVKTYIQSQSEAEREISDPASVSGLLRQQQSREMEQARKMWDKTSTSTSQHLAQLQGLNAATAFGLPGSMPGVNSPFGLGTMPLMSEMAVSKKPHTKDGAADKDKKSDTPKSSKEQQHHQEQQHHHQQQQQSQLQAAELAQMMALGGYLPGLDPAYLFSMYSGLPGYFSGMAAMPLLQPALLPGAEHLMAYDPLSFGTPLPLLQIPHQAIKNVSEKLQDPSCTLAQYTQDCKSLADLKGQVNALDATCATEAAVDVGYICKKCQMVYPVREACLTHQRMVCYVGGGEGGKTMLKLEQVQFECRVCADTFSTLYEFKVHCQADSHKSKVHKLGINFLPTSSSSSSSSSSSATTSSSSSSSSTKSALPAASLSVSPTLLSFMSGSSPHSGSGRASFSMAGGSPAHTASPRKSPVVAATAGSHDSSSEKDRPGRSEAKE